MEVSVAYDLVLDVRRMLGQFAFMRINSIFEGYISADLDKVGHFPVFSHYDLNVLGKDCFRCSA